MKYLVIFFMLCAPLMGMAQHIQPVLKSIEQNNLELQSQKQRLDAQKMQNRTVNNLSDPTASYGNSYSNLPHKGHSTDVTVVQSFDFPTLYRARYRQATQENQAVDASYQTLRRDILLRAKLLCLELVRLNQEANLMELRMKHADELQTLYETRLQTGDANMLEVNKIKIERMNVKTELARIHASHRLALQSLLAMNGNKPIEFGQAVYPEVTPIESYDLMRDRVVSSDRGLKMAEAYAKAAEKQVRVTKQQWLPKLQVGYTWSKDDVEKNNGFIVGASLPIFSNRKKVKIAQAQAISRKLEKEHAQLILENELMAQFNEMQQYKEALDACDVNVLNHSLSLLNQALDEGELSLIDYLIEAERVYVSLQNRMQLEHQYQQAMAIINKNEL